MNKKVVIAVVVVVVAAIVWYGYKNWGWFGAPIPAPAVVAH